MELDIIWDLIDSNPAWLSPFTVVYDIEYFVHPTAHHLGKGDLIMCDDAFEHFLVIEIKRNRKRIPKLISQMNYYHDILRLKLPDKRIDCAAVAGKSLIAYKPHNGGFRSTRFKRLMGQRDKNVRIARSSLSSTSGALCAHLR